MSGSYTFTWQWPATEVYVTGTFDNWSKSTKLEQQDGKFVATVELPLEKVLYKFVVDGNWVTEGNSPVEYDWSGNQNNVLFPEDIKVEPEMIETPAATEVPGFFPETPKEEEVPEVQVTEAETTLPGEFPETPASEIPMLPEVVTPQAVREEEGRGVFDIPEIAAQVPELVKDSIEEAGEPAEAAAVPEVVEQKIEVEEELLHEVPAAPAVTEVAEPVAEPTEPVETVPEIVRASQAEAGVEPEASGVAEAVEAKREVEDELQEEIEEVEEIPPVDMTDSYTSQSVYESAIFVPRPSGSSSADSSSMSDGTASITGDEAGTPITATTTNTEITLDKEPKKTTELINGTSSQEVIPKKKRRGFFALVKYYLLGVREKPRSREELAHA